jgi:hypothetical protein
VPEPARLTQPGNWTTCGECKTLCFFAPSGSSKCPGNSFDIGIQDPQGHDLFIVGNHKTAGPGFRLTTISGPNREPGWRICINCKALFWNGFADQRKGVCVGRPFVEGVQNVRDGHVDGGLVDLHLAFDVPVRPNQQPGWRWCDKCFELFFLPQNEYAECAAGEHHHAHPYKYVLDLA